MAIIFEYLNNCHVPNGSCCQFPPAKSNVDLLCLPVSSVAQSITCFKRRAFAQGIGGQFIQPRISETQRRLYLAGHLLLAKEVGDVVGA